MLVICDSNFLIVAGEHSRSIEGDDETTRLEFDANKLSESLILISDLSSSIINNDDEDEEDEEDDEEEDDDKA